MYNKARAQMLTHYRYCTTEQNERKMGPTATHADCYTTDGAMMTVGFTTGLTRRPKAPQPYRHSHPSCMRKTSSRRSPLSSPERGSACALDSKHPTDNQALRDVAPGSIATAPRSTSAQKQGGHSVPRAPPAGSVSPYLTPTGMNTDSAGASRGAIALTPQGLSLAAFL